MAAFSSVLNVTATTYPSNPQVTIDLFQPKRIMVQNADAGDAVYVSFDGVNDHGALLNDVKSPMCQQEWRYQMSQKVWLRTGSGSTTQVQVIAEG